MSGCIDRRRGDFPFPQPCVEMGSLAALVQSFIDNAVVFLFGFDEEFQLLGCKESQFLGEFTEKHFAVFLFIANTDDLFGR